MITHERNELPLIGDPKLMRGVMQCSLDGSNSFAAEPDRPSPEGSAGCEEVGSRQLTRQHCRIMGRATCGMALYLS